MIRTSYRNVLLVAPEIFPAQLTSGYKNVKHVNSIACIFPCIFESIPDLVIFDSDFMGSDLEKVVRRIKANKFYHKIKIFCYRSDHSLKAESLLKVLGVDQFIYKEDLIKATKSKTVNKTVYSVFDTSLILAGNVAD